MGEICITTATMLHKGREILVWSSNDLINDLDLVAYLDLVTIFFVHSTLNNNFA